MDSMKVGRRVLYAPAPWSPLRGLVVAHYAEDDYPWLVQWNTAAVVRRVRHGTDWLIPLCDDCGRVPSEHDETTSKCLFGAGKWR
jgi:hypothetical protein